MINLTTAWTASTLLLLLPLTIILPTSIGFTLLHHTHPSHNPYAFRNTNPTLNLGNRNRLLRAEESSLQSRSSKVSIGSSSLWSSESNDDDGSDHDANLKDDDREGLPDKRKRRQKAKYVLGDHGDAAMFWTPSDPLNKSKPITTDDDTATAATTATPASAVAKKDGSSSQATQEDHNQNVSSSSSPHSSATATKRYDLGDAKNSPVEYRVETNLGSKTIIANDAESQYLSKALWNYGANRDADYTNTVIQEDTPQTTGGPPPAQYETIDLAIPQTVYDPENNIDHVWTLLRHEAQREAQREPLLVSFLYSTILNHPNLESALAFHLANRLSSPSMMSTQIMSLIMEALDNSPTFRRDLRADIMAVRDRDPACTCLPDVFLHFKGFHALQTHRVANFFWATGRKTLAHYLQSQVSQNFQIDIHPNATLRSGIMLDHGTGIVIGETAVVGYNCSILHHVTLGGSGKAGVDRHPKVGNGVLLGAGASVLGNIKIGDGCQVGAGTLVIGDLPALSVAVGVPAKVIGKFRDDEAQPARSMNQVGTKESEAMIGEVGDGI